MAVYAAEAMFEIDELVYINGKRAWIKSVRFNIEDVGFEYKVAGSSEWYPEALIEIDIDEPELLFNEAYGN